ncbi:hypothetical protein [Neisseria sp.]|uniref:hypothetical protein n=1 Tax=Neisseria sp. TaxID=192066 RepID=UPI0035A11E51
MQPLWRCFKIRPAGNLFSDGLCLGAGWFLDALDKRRPFTQIRYVLPSSGRFGADGCKKYTNIVMPAQVGIYG